MIFKEEYVVNEKIYETTFSVIYKSISKKNSQENTIKLEKTPKSSDYLLNETKIRKLLECHEGILPIIDYGIYKSRRFIIYPFINGTLFRKKLNTAALFSCAFQLIETLSYIHSQGILHCDISATNILHDTTENKFYLSDFGQSKHYSFILNDTTTSPRYGCPLFCSENVHNGHEYTFRDDMISLGYLLFYCIEGKLPWCGLNKKREIIEQKEKFRKKFWNLNIPKELKIYLNYSFHLEINSRPEHNPLKKLFKGKQKQIEIQT
tara:strand:- start:12283 stop:13074 length:792 start_codon:yes stop_codon:yes gene_type:complete